jgi:micrococcal nuclease
MRRRRKVSVGVVAALALLAIAYLKRETRPPVSPGRPTPVPASVTRLCVRAVDGDTLELDGGERVRLIGVDTPETVDPRRPVQYFGKEASAFTRRLAQGRSVRLEYDQETRDRYGRTLAYVYLPDGTFLNAEIIRQGYGHAYTRFPFRYQAEFLALEREARAQERGLWAAR